MSLERKWWVFVILGIIIGLGVIYLRSLSNKVDNKTVISENRINDSKNNQLTLLS
jgi:uncharacterized membrane-anchored protein YhcB (DUF1043 family)